MDKQIAAYKQRGILAETSTGLTLVGDNSTEANSPVAQAHNLAMSELELKLADINEKLADAVAKLAAIASAVAGK
jgi:hypothetical protein